MANGMAEAFQTVVPAVYGEPRQLSETIPTW